MNICAIIVTFNRVGLLKKALEFYDNQTFKPNTLIIVNNNSSDETKSYLEIWKNEKSSYQKVIVNLNENLGGSGGFYTGLVESEKYNPDWVWLSDDDAFPEIDTFYKFNKFIEENNVGDDVAAISTTIMNNGKRDLTHRKRIQICSNEVKECSVSEEEYNNKYFELDLISYVGVFIKYSKLKEVGYTEKDYFIYYDDTEHSLRLRNVGKILCVPSLFVNHDVNMENSEEINWKKYYGIRNKIVTTGKHFNKKIYLILIIRYLKWTFKIKEKNVRNLYYNAIKDGIFLNLGINKTYKPGWKLEK